MGYRLSRHPLVTFKPSGKPSAKPGSSGRDNPAGPAGLRLFRWPRLNEAIFTKSAQKRPGRHLGGHLGGGSDSHLLLGSGLAGAGLADPRLGLAADDGFFGTGQLALETGIFLPDRPSDPRSGGQLFILSGPRSFPGAVCEDGLREILGFGAPDFRVSDPGHLPGHQTPVSGGQGDIWSWEDWEHDMALLRLFSALPALDPFSILEAARGAGLPIDTDLVSLSDRALEHRIRQDIAQTLAPVLLLADPALAQNMGGASGAELLRRRQGIHAGAVNPGPALDLAIDILDRRPALLTGFGIAPEGSGPTRIIEHWRAASFHRQVFLHEQQGALDMLAWLSQALSRISDRKDMTGRQLAVIGHQHRQLMERLGGLVVGERENVQRYEAARRALATRHNAAPLRRYFASGADIGRRSASLAGLHHALGVWNAEVALLQSCKGVQLSHLLLKISALLDQGRAPAAALGDARFGDGEGGDPSPRLTPVTIPASWLAAASPGDVTAGADGAGRAWLREAALKDKSEGGAVSAGAPRSAAPEPAAVTGLIPRVAGE